MLGHTHLSVGQQTRYNLRTSKNTLQIFLGGTTVPKTKNSLIHKFARNTWTLKEHNGKFQLHLIKLRILWEHPFHRIKIMNTYYCWTHKNKTWDKQDFSKSLLVILKFLIIILFSETLRCLKEGVKCIILIFFRNLTICCPSYVSREHIYKLENYAHFFNCIETMTVTHVVNMVSNT